MKLAKICGIYKITSPSKKVYIGQSVNIKKRWGDYKSLWCKSQTKIYNSIKKYSADKHVFEVLIECAPEKLNELEFFYIELYQSFNSKFGLNLKEGGKRSYKLSDETRKKISASNMGKVISEKTKQKIREKRKFQKATTGWKHTAEARKKMSEKTKGLVSIRKGVKLPPEQIEKLRSFNLGNKYCLGRKASNETRKKLSEAKRGRAVSIETRKKISNSSKGRKMSNESILKRTNTRVWCGEKGKAILNLQTGIFYYGITQAASSIGCSRNKLYKILNKPNTNKSNFIYV